MFVDTHTHFYDEWLLPDAEAAIQRALEAGVGKMIQADVDASERPAMWEVGARHPGVIFQMLGLYPGSVNETWREELDLVFSLAMEGAPSVAKKKVDAPEGAPSTANNATDGDTPKVAKKKVDAPEGAPSTANNATEGDTPEVAKKKVDAPSGVSPSAEPGWSEATQGVWGIRPPVSETKPTNAPAFVAVGEIGLDYHEGKEFVKEQKEVLRLQLELAAKLDLPVNIHLRDAWEDLVTILEDCRHLHLRGNLHCFGGSFEIFDRIRRSGDWSVGIGGVVTFKNSSLAKTLERIPVERILLETDAPYLAPVPYRGQRNESAYLPIIAAKVAEIKGLSLQEIESVTTRNAENLFGI